MVFTCYGLQFEVIQYHWSGLLKMLSSLFRGITDFSVIFRGLYYFMHIPRALPEFGYRLFAFATKSNKDAATCDMVNAESFLVLSSNLISLYNWTGNEDL